MAKGKKKHSKKDSVSDDLFDTAALSVKKFRKVTREIGRLSTGQKLVGSLVLVAAGFFYLDKLRDDATETTRPAPGNDSPRLAEAQAASAPLLLAAAPPRAADPRKNKKRAKAGKAAGSTNDG